MREAKIYCDLCKKKIDDYKYNFLWKTGFVKLELDRLGFRSENDFEYEDICRDCAEKISNFVKGLLCEKEVNLEASSSLIESNVGSIPTNRNVQDLANSKHEQPFYDVQEYYPPDEKPEVTILRKDFKELIELAWYAFNEEPEQINMKIFIKKMEQKLTEERM